MIRGIIQSVIEGVIKRFTAAGRPDETFTNREYFQHYGFTSRPLAGAEAIIIKEGNNIIMVASDDRRYRIALENGEVALYTDEGDKIHLKRDGQIEITATAKVTITAPECIVNAVTSVTATSPIITLIASEKVLAQTPLMRVEGDIEATGNITEQVA